MNRRDFLRSTAAPLVFVMFPNQLSSLEPSTLGPQHPLLAPFGGPHGGVPPFDRVKIADFVPALALGMDLQRAELAAIVANPEAPAFENTLLPLEDSGRPLSRVTSILRTYAASMNDKAMQAVEKETAPMLAA